jgi:hypothetical protein
MTKKGLQAAQKRPSALIDDSIKQIEGERRNRSPFGFAPKCAFQVLIDNANQVAGQRLN